VADSDVFIACADSSLKILAQRWWRRWRPTRDRFKAAVVFSLHAGGDAAHKLGTFCDGPAGPEQEAPRQLHEKRQGTAMRPASRTQMVETAHTPAHGSQYLPVGRRRRMPASFNAQLSVLVGGTPDTCRTLLLMLADKYVFPQGRHWPAALEVAEPVVVPRIWASGTPWAPGLFEDLKEYLNWNSQPRRTSAKGPRPVRVMSGAAAQPHRHRR